MNPVWLTFLFLPPSSSDPIVVLARLFHSFFFLFSFSPLASPLVVRFPFSSACRRCAYTSSDSCLTFGFCARGKAGEEVGEEGERGRLERTLGRSGLRSSAETCGARVSARESGAEGTHAVFKGLNGERVDSGLVHLDVQVWEELLGASPERGRQWEGPLDPTQTAYLELLTHSLGGYEVLV